jgi:hypothetical protein
VILALARGGLAGLRQIPTELVVGANLPAWLDPRDDRWHYVAALVPHILCIGVGTWRIGLLGGRLWAYLVVKKFGWMTDEQVEEFSRRDPKI